MLHSSDAEDWLKRGLCEAILVLCKSSLKFQSQFSINGLLAITVDQREVFLINVKETVGHSLEQTSFHDESSDAILDRDLQCGAFSVPCPRKVHRKRKIPEKVTKRDPGHSGENFGTALPKTERIPRQGEPDAPGTPPDLETHTGDPTSDDDEGGDKAGGDSASGLFSGRDFPDSGIAEQSVKEETRHKTEESTSGFDLALVKAEKEEEWADVYAPSDGHFQQTFQPQFQLYGAWQSGRDAAVRNGLYPNSGRPRGRRMPSTQLPIGSPIPEQFHQQALNRTMHQHSTQRRVAREGRCENCGTRKTTAWRRSDLKELLCNACGCYYKLHKYHRPLHMAQNEIKTRCRRSKQPDVGPPADDGRCHFDGLESDFNQSYFPGLIPS